MEQVQTCELALLIKQLKLSVKFPCRLTLQHSGRAISSQIQSNGTNLFAISRQVHLKEDKHKEHLEINVNLATDKGGNIMAGIIRINFADVANSQGETLTLSLQKCLDPHATCVFVVKSVKLGRSRARKGTEDRRQKNSADTSKFETKSQAMVNDPSRMVKPKVRFNEAESFGLKKGNFSGNPNLSPTISGFKEKAYSVVGYKGVNSSFERELASKFKHLNKREEDESKTIIASGNRRETDQVIKASLEASEKALKLQIIKFKTKYEQCEHNLEEKSRQIKSMREQMVELGRQVSEKQYLAEENSTKASHILKLEENNRALSRQLGEERARVVELERCVEEEKSANFMYVSRCKEESEKKEYDFQKSLYEKREELKEALEENQYKVGQINRMKGLIEELERSLDSKTYEYEKNYNYEKSQHSKAKLGYQQQHAELKGEIKRLQSRNDEMAVSSKKMEEELAKAQKKIEYIEAELLQSEVRYDDERVKRGELEEEKKICKRMEEELNAKLKSAAKDLVQKEKELEQLKNQHGESVGASRKKVGELLQKNKMLTAKVQELQNRTNLLSAQEEKIRRAFEIAQKEVKSLQESEKVAGKTLKMKDDRILQLERELMDVEGKSSLKEGLAKKQAEYKGMQLEKLTQRVAQLEKGEQKERALAEERRLELLKADNKFKMLEENNGRLNEQIKDLKQLMVRKDEDWSEKMRELKEELKTMESKEAEDGKALHSSQIEKINLRNEVGKLEKTVETLGEKVDKLKRKEQQFQNCIRNLQQDIELKNESILDLESSLKELENVHKTLQADKSKSEKITNIISEEKNVAKSDVGKLKKQIERRQQKEEQYVAEIKGFKEEIMRWELKFNGVSKDFEKFKANVQESIKNSLSVKNSYMTVDSFSPSYDHSKNVGKSRLKILDYSGVDSGELRLGETIESMAKQSQQMIMQLSEQLKRARREKELMEKESRAVSGKSKQTEEELGRQLKEVNSEMEAMTNQHATEVEELEEKIYNCEREIAKKEKVGRELEERYEQLKEVHVNLQTEYEIKQAQFLGKIGSLKSKIAEWERKDESLSQTFVKMEEKINGLQEDNTELTSQNFSLSENLAKKQKQCLHQVELHEQLYQELESVKKMKSSLSAQVLSLKQNLIVERESRKQLLLELKSEEEKNSHLKKFNNDILRDKEGYIKKQTEREEKMYDLQEKIQVGLIAIAEKTEEIAVKERLIAQCKEQIKAMQGQNAGLSGTVMELRSLLQKQRQKVKEKERKVTQKQAEIDSLNALLKRTSSKYQTQLVQLNEEYHSLNSEHSKLKDVSSHRQNELEFQVKKLADSQKKANETNVALQEQIFFEKQMNSINHSKIEDLSMQIMELNVERDKLMNSIDGLNDEVRQKEESLFELSGKLYVADNRLEIREEEYKARGEKAEMEWRCKIQQICQQYENKIQLLEKQRSYADSGIEGYNEKILKVESQKKSLSYELEKERDAWQLRMKKVEEQKLAVLVQKNKQEQRSREVVEQMEEKLKKREFDYRSLEEDKRKVEDRLKELRYEVEKAEDKKGHAIRNMEKEIDQLKRKEGQLKRFKEAMKNNQWAIEREIKKSIQLSAKGVTALAVHQSKDEVMSIMRNLEASVTKIALPNIDEL